MRGLLDTLMAARIMDSIPEIDKNDIIIFVEKFMSNYDAEEITFQDIIDYGRRNSGNLPPETLNDEIHNRVINLVWLYYEESKEIESNHYHKVLLTVMKK